MKDPDRTSLPSKLPKTISVSFIKPSVHFTNIPSGIMILRTATLPYGRALIGDSASVACSATHLRRVPRRAPPPESKDCDICANTRLKTKQQTAFKHLPNLEKAYFGIPWAVLEQKRADHTHTPEVRSNSGPASPRPGQSIKKRKT